MVGSCQHPAIHGGLGEATSHPKKIEEICRTDRKQPHNENLYIPQSSEMAVPKLLVTRSDEVMSGDVVFAGTRAPVQMLLDYLEEGDTLAHFLQDFQSVSREHAVAVLELEKATKNEEIGYFKEIAN